MAKSPYHFIMTEKVDLMSRPNSPLNGPKSRHRWTLRHILATILTTLLSLWLFILVWPLDYAARFFSESSYFPTRKYAAKPNPHDFRWGDIVPSESLQYTPCFSSFQCARLSVPLNWNSTIAEQENGPRAAIAIIKLPAKVPVTDPRYGGPVILNPGGPGESGIYQVLSDGKHLQTILDSPVPPFGSGSTLSDGKYFDIVSFDPRGVNNTTPRLRCFPDAFNQQAWLLRYLDFGLLWDSEGIIGYEWARATALGASCSHEEADGGILPYVNTAQVVGDMVEMLERAGEWRALEVERLLSRAEEGGTEPRQSIIDRTAYHRGLEKLQYWGMSYGTLIGSTFAALYPDRVGRLLIDGVVDPADHYAGGWLTSLQDSDAIISRFSEYCFEAGPEKCPLYTGSSPADVQTRFTSIMLSLKKSPIHVPLPPSGNSIVGPELITYGDAHLYMLSSMYFPFATVESFWKLLVAFESRNTTSPDVIGVGISKQAQLSQPECQEEDPFLYPCIPYNSMLGPNQAIGCMDMGGSTDLTRESFNEFLDLLKAQSRWISPSWARNKLGCLGYTTKPAWRPNLTFKTQEWQNTSYPLLIIGNTHDTVTPLRNARRVSTLFPGSVVLQQNSQGHCSHSSPSLCTGRTVRAYFQTGSLPQVGSVCETEMKPFLGCAKKEGCDFMNIEDRALWESMVELSDPFGLRKTDIRSDVHMERLDNLLDRRGVLGV
jgi:pimeloyl-ACP methyl ester carboxylesterase